jgi:hypothetical protein
MNKISQILLDCFYFPIHNGIISLKYTSLLIVYVADREYFNQLTAIDHPHIRHSMLEDGSYYE